MESKLKHWVIDEEGCPQPEDRPSNRSYASPHEALIIEDSAVIFVDDNNKIVEAFCYYNAEYGLFSRINGRWYLLGLWDEWEEAMNLNKFLADAKVIKFKDPPTQWKTDTFF